MKRFLIFLMVICSCLFLFGCNESTDVVDVETTKDVVSNPSMPEFLDYGIENELLVQCSENGYSACATRPCSSSESEQFSGMDANYAIYNIVSSSEISAYDYYIKQYLEILNEYITPVDEYSQYLKYNSSVSNLYHYGDNYYYHGLRFNDKGIREFYWCIVNNDALYICVIANSVYRDEAMSVFNNILGVDSDIVSWQE